MSKIDCHNIENFISEWERRKKIDRGNHWQSIDVCLDTGFGIRLGNIQDAFNTIVESLQEWSDSHPKITRREKFIKMCEENGFADLIHTARRINCQYYNGGEGMPCVMYDCNECKKYWEELV